MENIKPETVVVAVSNQETKEVLNEKIKEQIKKVLPTILNFLRESLKQKTKKTNKSIKKLMPNMLNVVRGGLNKKTKKKSELKLANDLNLKGLEKTEKKPPAAFEIRVEKDIDENGVENLKIIIDDPDYVLDFEEVENVLWDEIDKNLVKTNTVEDFIKDFIKNKEGRDYLVKDHEKFKDEMKKHSKYLYDLRFEYGKEMIKKLKEVKENFENKPKNSKNSLSIKLIKEDLNNLEQQINGGYKKFTEILGNINRKFNEFSSKVKLLDVLEKNPQIENYDEEVENLISEIIITFNELGCLKEELSEDVLEDYIIKSNKMIAKLEEIWGKYFKIKIK